MIKLNLIDDKVMFFKVLDKNNTIMKDEMISLKNILKDKFKSKPFNNKVNDMMLKEIENYFCEHINGNHKYNLTNVSSYSNKRKRYTNNDIKTKTFNNNNFNVISTLFSSVKLVVYNCSHRQSLPKQIHRLTKSIVTVPKNCLIIYNCGLYHGHRKTNCEDIRMSFQLLSDSLPYNDPFEDSATKHLCLPSCNKCISNKFQGDMKLIDTETSSLKEKYIDSLLDGSFVLGNLDLVGWVIIKNSFKI